jgi:micrococcal nuclease
MNTNRSLLARIITPAALFCLIAAFAFHLFDSSGAVAIDPDSLYAVAHIVDGDTIDVRKGNRLITIRLLGIDAPESVDRRRGLQCFGMESSDELRHLLQGRQVRLKLNPNREAADRYGRYLAYVYREDGLFVNEDLISRGFAREYTYGRTYESREAFMLAEARARQEGRGLWSACPLTDS